MLEAQGLTAWYRKDRVVLRDVTLSVAAGEVVALAGPNGVGKSTLLKTLLGLMRPKCGEIRVGGRLLAKLSPRERALAMAYAPQAAATAFPTCVFDAVLLGRRAHLGWRASPRDWQIVEQCLDRLGLTELAMHDVGCLSGGQRQKVVLARALVQDARFLLLDEPTSNLDLRCQLECLDVVQKAAHVEGRGVLVALHDLNLVSRYADRVVLLHLGSIVADGSPHQVLDRQAIRLVYGVDVAITHGEGHRHILALNPIDERHCDP